MGSPADEMDGFSFGTRELLEGIGVPALVTDPRRVALWANQPFCDLFGVEGGPSALIGRPLTPLAERVSREFRDPDRFLEGIARSLEAGVPVSGEVLEHIDGRLVARAYYPIRVDGRVIAHVWRYDDVTEVHRHGVMIERALAAAERANAAKTQLLGRVSHELRTPLNAVLGFAQLLGRNEPDERRARWIAQIEEAGRHVLAQVEDLLDLAAAESGHLRVNLATVDLDSLVDAVHALMAPLANERSVTVRVHHGGVVATADLDRLRVVLINLVSNAIKFNERGGSVDIRVDEVDADTVRVTVTDDGPGIPAEKFDEAFVMFERLDGADRGVPGAGLGLAIARDYAKAMGGQLHGRPGAERGAELWVTLPRAPRDHSGEMPRPDSGQWVLYVEDNAMNAEVVVASLDAEFGLRVEVAPTLAAARAELASRRPSLLLVDLNLPDGSGAHLAEEQCTVVDGPSVALVTADAFAANEAAARIERLAGILLKPLDFEELRKLTLTALPELHQRWNGSTRSP